MRLIDADELEKEIYKWMPKDQETWMDSEIPPIENLIVSIMMTIQEQPTVEAIPIDVDAFIKELEKWNAELQTQSILYGIPTLDRQLGVTDAITIARQMPAVDAVPVIRCRNCKYNLNGLCDQISIDWHPFRVEDDEFCAWAERKEE